MSLSSPLRSRRPGSRRPLLRLAFALPFVTGLLALGVGVYAFQVGRNDATAMLAPREAVRVWATAPQSWMWLAGLTLFGVLIGLSIALAFTRQLRALARRTEFLARRNFSFPVDIEADGEVAPLVSAINELLESVRDYARHSVSDGLLSVARDGRVLSINPRAAVALGVEAEDIIGRAFTELLPEAPANEPARAAIERALGDSQPFDLKGLTWLTPRGQRLRVDLQGTVFAGPETIISLLIVFEAADMEAVQRQVGRAHRLMVIGGFAAELAHEVRNPLSSVSGLVDLLADRLPPGDEGHRHLAVLLRAAERIDRLVGQLLDLVPTEIHDLERRDLNGLVRDSIELVRVGEPRRDRVELIDSYEPDLPRWMVDPDRLSRAVENLLRNAYAHTPDGGQIRVQTRATTGGGIDIEVANTGSFVAPDEHELIFQPFKSGRGSGTGLGLAIAQQIAFAHGGTIELESVEGSHTAFVLRLPAEPGAVFASAESLAGAA